MALSASGAISFSQIQTEFGGSNPISLSEYYSGSIAGNTSSTTLTPTVTSYSASYTSGKNTYYKYADGWGHSSVTAMPLSGSTSSLTISPRTGVDKTGNAGAIPSSGTIQANHFRGTDAGSTTSYTIYGVAVFRDTGSAIPNYGHVYVGGHVGTPGTYSTATGGPIVSISCAAKGNFAATSIFLNTSTNTNAAGQGANTFFNGRYMVNQVNNGTIGNYTVFVFLGSSGVTLGLESNPTNAMSGTWSQTFNF